MVNMQLSSGHDPAAQFYDVALSSQTDANCLDVQKHVNTDFNGLRRDSPSLPITQKALQQLPVLGSNQLLVMFLCKLIIK